ncbi:MAG TPA: MFS transporter [Mycobacteriales bacterium]|nr:MFS transporter [Mycobacteriales bacterium]
MRPYLDLLRRERDFRRAYGAQLIALGADWFAVIPLLVLLPELTGRGLWGALVLAADTLAFAAVAPYAGTVVDRLDRRTVIVVANVAGAGAALLLLLVRSEATAWVALAGIGLMAAAKAFAQPAHAAAVPNLVDRDDLATAAVLSGASWGTMLAVGAALGGLVAGTLGTTACFVTVAVLLLFAAWQVGRTERPFSDPSAPVRERRPARADIAEAAGYALRDKPVLALMTVKIGPATGNGALSLFPLFGAAAFGLGPLGVGLMYSARGLGALIGPLLLRHRAQDPRALYPVLAVSMAVFGVAYLLLAATPWFAGVLALLVVAHAGGGANWILSTYGLQATVPDALLGRVFSADYMLATLVIAASQVVFGLLSDAVPARELLAASGAAVLLYSLLWWSATRRLRRPAGAPVDPGD